MRDENPLPFALSTPALLQYSLAQRLPPARAPLLSSDPHSLLRNLFDTTDLLGLGLPLSSVRLWPCAAREASVATHFRNDQSSLRRPAPPDNRDSGSTSAIAGDLLQTLRGCTRPSHAGLKKKNRVKRSSSAVSILCLEQPDCLRT